MRLRLVLLAVAASALSSRTVRAQAAADPVATHRAAYQLIERSLPRYRQASADMDSLGLERQSADGGNVKAYCDGSTLRLLVADYYGESGDATYRFYFDHDSLFFVFLNSRRGLRSEGNPYPERTIREHQRFYFTDAHLIRWLNPKNISQSLSSASAKRWERELLEDSHRLSAAMPECEPKYAP
jgi:hypothetical protein